MKGLPSSCKSFNLVIMQSKKMLTFSEFKVALRCFEENEKASVQQHTNSKIMEANFRKMNLNEQNNHNGGKIVCFSCNQEGHKSSNCWSKQRNYNNSDSSRVEKLWCRNCKSSTHSDKTCRRRRNGDQAKHIRNDQEVSENHSFEFNFCCKSGEEGDVDSVVDAVKVVNQKAESETLLVDTGATSHIVNKDEFIDVDDSYIPENHYIELADGTRTNSVAKKRGTVCVNITDKNGEVRSAILERALYCPNYPQNIYSVRAATKKGAEVHFSKDHDELITEEGVSFPIHRKGELYYLYNVSTGFRDVQSCSLDTWHKILGHCNVADILRLEKVVDGMKVTDKMESHCSSCVVGKQTLNRSKNPDQRAKAPLEFVHSDITGPIEPAAKDGFRYVATYTDDYSGAIFAYFMKNKDDTVYTLEKFLADSSPFGKVKTMLRLRTDNGGEFISKQYEDLLLSKGIKHETTGPYRPHQNGTAERGFRTLFEMARCMLIDSGAPKYLWSYAIMASVYIRNRCFQQRTGQTPYFLLTGCKPNLKKMNIFGTVCYGYVH